MSHSEELGAEPEQQGEQATHTQKNSSTDLTSNATTLVLHSGEHAFADVSTNSSLCRPTGYDGTVCCRSCSSDTYLLT